MSLISNQDSNKIELALAPYAGLANYIRFKTGDRLQGVDNYQIRIVWINKLLEYTGE